jgi:2-dehydro-3-deoxyphosphogluconate aldolase/(4S)-4-hydroxy-2-oxoglutarate aldolase
MQNWRELFHHTKIIPVVVIDDADNALPLAEAILKGGIDVIEITFRTEASSESIRRIRMHLPEMLVGAGTLVTKRHIEQAIDADVQFGLAPGLNPATIEAFRQANTLFIPGVMTASEIEQAYALGCDLVKFFPAEQAGGVSMLKALSAPYAHLDMHFCPTGGINLNGMNNYLALPSVAAVGGSWLASQQDIAAGNWSAITHNIRQALARIQQ